MAAVNKVLEHLHAAHDALAHVVRCRQTSPAGSDPMSRDPPQSGKQLKAAIHRCDALAAFAPLAYQANHAWPGVHSEEALRGASPGLGPATQGQLQEELERQAAALEEDIRHLLALLTADRKGAIKDFWRRHAPDIVERREAVRGTIKVEALGLLGSGNVPVPNTQTLLTEQGREGICDTSPTPRPQKQRNRHPRPPHTLQGTSPQQGDRDGKKETTHEEAANTAERRMDGISACHREKTRTYNKCKRYARCPQATAAGIYTQAM